MNKSSDSAKCLNLAVGRKSSDSKVRALALTNVSSVRINPASFSESGWRTLLHLRARDQLPAFLDLVNLQGDDTAYFRKHWRLYGPRETDEALLRMRDQLRLALDSDAALASVINDLLTNHAPSGSVPSDVPVNTLFLDLKSMQLVPYFQDLRLTLLFALLRYRAKVRLCANSECSTYFLYGRRTQRFCGKPTCHREAQRMAKLTWWNKKGSAWRATRKTAKAVSGKKRSTQKAR